MRWLRGRVRHPHRRSRALGVRTIVDDAGLHDQLKLMARFVRLAGYDGLLVCLDELVNLHKTRHAQARAANYEQMLSISTTACRDSAAHLGLLFGGTPDFLLDTRRGMFSYPALASRLTENTFATDPGSSTPRVRCYGWPTCRRRICTCC